MDKSWIYEDRFSLTYELGLESFFNFAKENASNAKKVRCPCTKCVNFKKKSFKKIREHCNRFGFSLDYTNWIWHGELALSPCGGTPQDFSHARSEAIDMFEATFEEGDYDEDSIEFRNFVEDAQNPLFDGSEHSKSDALVKLHRLKAKFGLSDTCFTEVLEVVSSLLPNENVLPQTLYESKKTLNKLGFEYDKIHALGVLSNFLNDVSHVGCCIL